MECLLSIIIPIYNAELFLERCVESTLDSEDSRYEIILIDDGSMDGSWPICEYFKQKNCRVRAYHYENNGVSAARNVGIEKAKGKMIFFLDADDYLEPGSVDRLLHETEDVESEFVIYAYNLVTFEERRKSKVSPFSEGKLDVETFIKCLVTSSYMNFCWGKLYSRSIIDDHKIKFSTGLKIGEDVDFQIQYIKLDLLIKFKNDILVNYVQNTKSVMHQYGYNRFFDLESAYYTRKKLAEQIRLSEEEWLTMYEDLGRILLSYIFRIRYSKKQAYDVYKLKRILEKDCFIDILKNMPINSMGIKRYVISMLIIHKHYNILILLIKVLRHLIS